ncbi:LytR/AlgR family response regulator transcription factor [Hymenobacter jejuensis]|uniref:Response regulator transcription factor n=1 Tax=Hymenobacter jejuensis TaxID=2502781 RepID=A0A5B7ZVR7_9BACT|nr:LytTR family DNA-binding domain-containing protein [Hymenobacter jejuensis]QDA58899.1 response regulator transcription factor [Hymenobacter jejuensis]
MNYQAIIVDDEQLTHQAIHRSLNQLPATQLLESPSDGAEAALHILRHRPEIVFLSIQLPRLDGFSVLKEVWLHYQPCLVFLTVPDSYVQQHLETSGANHLVKPFTTMQLQQAIGRVKTDLAQQNHREVDQLLHNLLSEGQPSRAYIKRLLVKDQRKMFFIKVDDILYFDADGNYITLHTAKRNYTIYESLTQLEQRLDPADFTRINRSYIVNLNYIEELESYFNGEYLVRLVGGHCLKWTRFYRDNVKAFLSKDT